VRADPRPLTPADPTCRPAADASIDSHVFVWFAAAAFVAVVLVFSSPAIDYRLVMLGAVLPVLEGLLGGPYLLHTLLGSVVVLVAVVLVTRGRRLTARRLVGLPIGLFLHLVLDGTWTRAELFWWPFLGVDALGEGQIPEIDHLALSLVLEAAGIVLALWAVRRFRLTEPARRSEFLRTGRLGRDLLR
jgi:membrane-bound metal-dependent hydrolase YbcI (DUF457 family)